VKITPLTRSPSGDFAGDVAGVNLTEPLTAEQIAEIDAGMDRYAVLVFRDQPLTDEQQCAYSRNFGELEATLIAQMSKPGERRLGPVEMGDISNLDPRGKVRGRDDSRRMYALGNRLWHSDASFRATGARYSLLSARAVPGYGGNTEFADMRAAYDALDDATKAQIADLITEHSIAFSRGELGFDDYGEGNADKVRPVRHSLVRMHPVTGRMSLYLSAHIGTIVGWPGRKPGPSSAI
jgi:alpha-ketoglutarate-dependent 2,4-dichlorophenoxyacetate dioxygenase